MGLSGKIVEEAMKWSNRTCDELLALSTFDILPQITLNRLIHHAEHALLFIVCINTRKFGCNQAVVLQTREEWFVPRFVGRGGMLWETTQTRGKNYVEERGSKQASKQVCCLRLMMISADKRAKS